MGQGADRQERAARAAQLRQDREKAERRRRTLITVGIVAVVVVLIALAAFAISRSGKDPADAVAPDGASQDYGFELTATDVGGTAGTDPVRVTLYEDFQCPICAVFEQQVAPALIDLVKAGEIVIEYRPISFLDDQSLNGYATRSLNASLCVLDTGGVAQWKTFHDALFAAQPAEGTAGPEDPALIATAEQAGATGIDDCVKSLKFGDWIDAAYDRAVSDGFPGTPWVQVDGTTIDNPTLANIQAAIDEARG